MQQGVDVGVGAAGTAFRIPRYLVLAELALQRLIYHEAADQRTSQLEQHPDGLRRLEQTAYSCAPAQDTGVFSSRGQRGRGRLGEEAAIARPLSGHEHGALALKSENAA